MTDLAWADHHRESQLKQKNPHIAGTQQLIWRAIAYILTGLSSTYFCTTLKSQLLFSSLSFPFDNLEGASMSGHWQLNSTVDIWHFPSCAMFRVLFSPRGTNLPRWLHCSLLPNPSPLSPWDCTIHLRMQSALNQLHLLIPSCLAVVRPPPMASRVRQSQAKIQAISSMSALLVLELFHLKWSSTFLMQSQESFDWTTPVRSLISPSVLFCSLFQPDMLPFFSMGNLSPLLFISLLFWYTVAHMIYTRLSIFGPSPLILAPQVAALEGERDSWRICWTMLCCTSMVHAYRPQLMDEIPS